MLQTNYHTLHLIKLKMIKKKKNIILKVVIVKKNKSKQRNTRKFNINYLLKIKKNIKHHYF